MSQNSLKILWKDGRSIGIVLADNPVAEFYYRCVKNLQHLDLTFGPRENPYHPLTQNTEKNKDMIVSGFAQFDIDVDREKLTQQDYLNHLHDIYFRMCNSNPEKGYYTRWSYVHDYIHNQETINNNLIPQRAAIFNYRDLAGLLYKKFDRTLLQYGQYDFSAGTCFLREQELGKSPLIYYRDGEPADVDFMCTISKPWVNLIPTMNIATEDIQASPVPADFVEWFAPLKEAWCQHWQLDNWTPEEIKIGIPIGQVTDLATLVDCFQKEDYPYRITQ